MIIQRIILKVLFHCRKYYQSSLCPVGHDEAVDGMMDLKIVKNVLFLILN